MFTYLNLQNPSYGHVISIIKQLEFFGTSCLNGQLDPIIGRTDLEVHLDFVAGHEEVPDVGSFVAQIGGHIDATVNPANPADVSYDTVGFVSLKATGTAVHAICAALRDKCHLHRPSGSAKVPEHVRAAVVVALNMTGLCPPNQNSKYLRNHFSPGYGGAVVSTYTSVLGMPLLQNFAVQCGGSGSGVDSDQDDGSGGEEEGSALGVLPGAHLANPMPGTARRSGGSATMTFTANANWTNAPRGTGWRGGCAQLGAAAKFRVVSYDPHASSIDAHAALFTSVCDLPVIAMLISATEEALKTETLELVLTGPAGGELNQRAHVELAEWLYYLCAKFLVDVLWLNIAQHLLFRAAFYGGGDDDSVRVGLGLRPARPPALAADGIPEAPLSIAGYRVCASNVPALMSDVSAALNAGSIQASEFSGRVLEAHSAAFHADAADRVLAAAAVEAEQARLEQEKKDNALYAEHGASFRSRMGLHGSGPSDEGRLATRTKTAFFALAAMGACSTTANRYVLHLNMCRAVHFDLRSRS